MAFSAGMTAFRSGTNHEYGQSASDKADNEKEKKAEAIGETATHLPGQNPGIVKRLGVQHRENDESANAGREKRYPYGRADVTFSLTPTAWHFLPFIVQRNLPLLAEPGSGIG